MPTHATQRDRSAGLRSMSPQSDRSPDRGHEPTSFVTAIDTKTDGFRRVCTVNGLTRGNAQRDWRSQQTPRVRRPASALRSVPAPSAAPHSASTARRQPVRATGGHLNQAAATGERTDPVAGDVHRELLTRRGQQDGYRCAERTERCPSATISTGVSTRTESSPVRVASCTRSSRT